MARADAPGVARCEQKVCHSRCTPFCPIATSEHTTSDSFRSGLAPAPYYFGAFPVIWV